MATIRKPLQGVRNIVRFNWHFYALSFLAILVFLAFDYLTDKQYHLYVLVLAILMALPITLSLLVSFYIYDLSPLYSFFWLKKYIPQRLDSMVNINAGFDETSAILHAYFPDTKLTVFDFYDEKKHTEVSIKRARQAYPPYAGTHIITTNTLPLPDGSVDIVCLIFAAHEIRDDTERVIFFNELKRVLKPNGYVTVTEHLRDGSNFLAYTIGFLHFLSRRTWNNTFKQSGFTIQQQIKTTPFVTTFILQKNGIAS